MLPDWFGRFISRVEVTPACWNWTWGTGSHGYGSMSVDSRPCLVHRLSYEFFKGPIPEGLTVDHLCHNRLCVRPSHLEAVTGAENSRRATPRWDRCGKNHEPNWNERRDGKGRYCRPCAAESARRRYHARKMTAGDEAA